MSNFDMSSLGVTVDMAGCPNRFRHCWLGNRKNGRMSVDEFSEIAAQFKRWRDENGDGIAELCFFSWWLEPDYRDDYRGLWALEQELSSPGRAQRFELLCPPGGWPGTRNTRIGRRCSRQRHARSAFSAWKTALTGE